MRLGILLPALSSLGNPASGVMALAMGTADALERSGEFDVYRLSPWQHSRNLNLDLIHAFGGPEGFGGGPQLTSVPWILSPVHDSRMSSWKYRLAIRAGSVHPRVSTVPAQKRMLYRQVERLAVLSDDERRRISSACGVPSDKISIVNAAVARPRVVAEAEQVRVRAQFGLPPKFALAVCDYGAPRKNIPRLVNACEAAGITLVLGGHARGLKATSKAVTLWSNKHWVRIIGEITNDDLPVLMSLADVYCQPSLEEGAGMAAMEAATYGSPILTSDVGGIREHLGPEAVYVDPLDVGAIAKGLRDAIEMGRTGRVGEFVLAHRTWPNTVDQLGAAYRRVLGAG